MHAFYIIEMFWMNILEKIKDKWSVDVLPIVWELKLLFCDSIIIIKSKFYLYLQYQIRWKIIHKSHNQRSVNVSNVFSSCFIIVLLTHNVLHIFSILCINCTYHNSYIVCMFACGWVRSACIVMKIIYEMLYALLY